MEHIATIFATEGADACGRGPRRSLPPGTKVRQVRRGARPARRRRKTSSTCGSSPACRGSRWARAIQDHKEIDLYLEGERPASRVVSLVAAGRGRMKGSAPYREVITHGFVLDEEASRIRKHNELGAQARAGRPATSSPRA